MKPITPKTPQQAQQPALILASSSIYRRALLERLNIDFSTQSPDIDETPKTTESAVDYVQRLAVEKAMAISAKLANGKSDSIIIGSDQTLVLNQKILGKPEHPEAAQKMLQDCSGQSVWFYCGWALWKPDQGLLASGMQPTEVVFRQLSTEEIQRYTVKEPAFDCAGAFKSEALGITLFDALRSDDPTALIGLPLIAICKALREVGFQLP